jgi:hypothetical protein
MVPVRYMMGSGPAYFEATVPGVTPQIFTDSDVVKLRAKLQQHLDESEKLVWTHQLQLRIGTQGGMRIKLPGPSFVDGVQYYRAVETGCKISMDWETVSSTKNANGEELHRYGTNPPHRGKLTDRETGIGSEDRYIYLEQTEETVAMVTALHLAMHGLGTRIVDYVQGYGANAIPRLTSLLQQVLPVDEPMRMAKATAAAEEFSKLYGSAEWFISMGVGEKSESGRLQLHLYVDKTKAKKTQLPVRLQVTKVQGWRDHAVQLHFVGRPKPLTK